MAIGMVAAVVMVVICGDSSSSSSNMIIIITVLLDVDSSRSVCSISLRQYIFIAIAKC